MVIVQPAPFSSCSGFDGPCSTGCERSFRLGYGAWHSGVALDAGPRSPTIRPPVETNDISQHEDQVGEP